MNNTPQEYQLNLQRQIAVFKRLIPPSLTLATLVTYWLAGNEWPRIGFLLLNAVLIPLVLFSLFKRIDTWLVGYEQAAKDSSTWRQQLIALVDSSVDAMICANREGNIISWNTGAEHLFGYISKEIIGCPLTALFGHGPAAGVETQWLIDTIRRERIVLKHETSCVDAFGHKIFVELAASTTDDAESVQPILIVLRNISSRKARENEAKRISDQHARKSIARARELALTIENLAQANIELTQVDQTRSEFVSLVSHQIRSPLTNIAGAVQRMQADCAAINPTCSRMFNILEQQTARLDGLVSNVLNATRIEAGELVLQPEPISLVPVVQQVIQQFSARASTHEFRFSDKPGLPFALADRDRVVEVLSNLLDNACKYAPPNDAIAVDVRADQNELTISVRDHGPGIPEEKLKHLFTKFYRIDSGDSQSAYGYGLGLYVCRLLVEEQRGRIWAENHPNGGSVFAFSLPVWES